MAVSFTMYRGDTADIALSFEDSDGDAYDLTGLTLTITANPDQNPTDATDELWSVSMTASSPTSGVAVFNLDATQADMDPGIIWFDVEGVNGSSQIKTLAKSTFRVIEDINK